MFWKKKPKIQTDFIDDDVPDILKDVMQSKGIHRDILEVQNIKANKELAEQTLRSLKYQNITNLIYLLIGAFIPIVYSAFFNPELKRVQEVEQENRKVFKNFNEYKVKNDAEIRKLRKEMSEKKE